jgi:hypothetical protein
MKTKLIAPCPTFPGPCRRGWPAFPGLIAVLVSITASCPVPALRAAAAPAPAPEWLEINPGPLERRQCTIHFKLPAAFTADALLHAGKTYPIQTNEAGSASVTIDHIAAGEPTRFQFISGNIAPAKVRIHQQKSGTRLEFSRQMATQGTNKTTPLFAYQAEPGEFPRADIKDVFRRGGYLHPIYAPGGQIVTDDFPVNHVHHHGVWWAWTKTEFQGRQPDFWNMGDGKGRVEFAALDASWDGPVHGGFRARHRFVDQSTQPAVVALEETWTVTTYAQPVDAAGGWIFDLVSEQKCATGDALKLPENRYGGIGLRGNWAWNGKTNAQFLTANGESDRVKGHATRAKWCDLSGRINGRRVGITVLGHPSNFRFPEPMRIHPDEPFFNFAPQQAGDMEIQPNKPYVARYRFFVHDGSPDTPTIDRLWNDFATPPTVTWGPK